MLAFERVLRIRARRPDGKLSRGNSTWSPALRHYWTSSLSPSSAAAQPDSCGNLFSRRATARNDRLWDIDQDLVPPRWREGGETKTAKSRRTLALPQAAIQALRDHRKRQAEDRLAAGSLCQDHGLVFASASGTPLDAANVRHEFRKITEAAGLGVGCVPRDLRHTFVSLMSADGVPIEEIALVWGQGRRGPTQADGSGSRRREVNLRTSSGAVRQAAQDTDAKYQALLAQRREYALREPQTQRERQADPARRGRLAEDQARIDAVLAETEQ